MRGVPEDTPAGHPPPALGSPCDGSSYLLRRLADGCRGAARARGRHRRGVLRDHAGERAGHRDTCTRRPAPRPGAGDRRRGRRRGRLPPRPEPDGPHRLPSTPSHEVEDAIARDPGRARRTAAGPAGGAEEPQRAVRRRGPPHARRASDWDRRRPRRAGAAGRCSGSSTGRCRLPQHLGRRHRGPEGHPPLARRRAPDRLPARVRPVGLRAPPDAGRPAATAGGGGAQPVPGRDGPSHRARQPQPSRGGHEGRAGPAEDPRGAPLPRPGPVQAGQRPPGTPRR